MMMKFPPSRILVPIDLSEPSMAALDAAKALAKRWHASLDLVYVEDVPINLYGFNANGGDFGVPLLVQEMENYRKWREDRMKKAAAGFPASRVKIRIVRGWAPRTLTEMTRRKTADLLVMGTHGYGGLDRMLFGSVAEALVRRSEIPVLTVHPRISRFQPANILVPFNMEPYADKALAYASTLAHGLNAKLSVMYVINESWDPETARLQLKRHVETIIGKAAAHRIHWIVAHGDSREVILQEALHGKFDLIVLSAHRRPFWTDYILGSTAERILRHSPVPVISIPSVGPKARRHTALRLSAGGVPTEKIYVS